MADAVAPEPQPPERVIDPCLVAMEDALDRGDHVETARLARTLTHSDDPETQTAGRAMIERLRPDPMILGVMISTGFLIVALALGYLGRH